MEGDFALYRHVVEREDIYNVLLHKLDSMGHKGLTRDAVKLALLRDVIAKKGNYPSPVESAFEALFPSVHRYIKWVNGDYHGQLIRDLQRAEADLVIGTLAPRLVKHKGLFFITLHDSVFAKESEIGIVREEFNNLIKDYGVRIRLKPAA